MNTRSRVGGLAMAAMATATILAADCGGKSQRGRASDGSRAPDGEATDGGVLGDVLVPVDADSRNDAGSMGVGDPTDARGDLGGADSVGPVSACSGDVGARIPRAPLRRLTKLEYRNTLGDLFEVSVPPSTLLDDSLPLPVGQETTQILGELTDAYHTAAHEIAVNVTANSEAVKTFTRCDVATGTETVCVKQFLQSFLALAFRRPVDATDMSDFDAIFAQGRMLGGSYASGIRAVVEVVLQSPEFLYLIEFGEPVDANRPGLGRPRPPEMAARISYLLWGSAPDDVLREAAAQDRLKTKADIEAQARRLLADARARRVPRQFYGQLLGVGDLEIANHAGVTTDLRKFQLQETAMFVDDVVWNQPGTLKLLLTAPFSFVNETLATLYGIDGVTGPALRKTPLPGGQRLGLLTQASVLATWPEAAHTNPSRRGMVILDGLLCQGIIRPSSHLPNTIQPPAPGATEMWRQHWQLLTKEAACQGCHRLFDGIGLAFEHYDGLGRWRDTDGTASIDAQGEIVGGDVAGKFDGVLELAARLADSKDVQACHVQKWMQFAYGREMMLEDACSRETLQNAFRQTNGNLRELLLGLTQTEAFLFRPLPGP
ncbi:MAG: DUF1592 domain-containing protein [Myxococcales bacterium]